MPKRSKSVSQNRKEKQIIRARLIEISLKVDDYVYNHKPISETEADHYLREVVSYKMQCEHDERSLQVIEKLTRCMKTIMLELHQQKGNTSNVNFGSHFQGHEKREVSISPVYSIPDEDRTQFTPIDEEGTHTITKSYNEDSEIINLCDIDDGHHQAIRENVNCNKSYSGYFPGHNDCEDSISLVDKSRTHFTQINKVTHRYIVLNEKTEDIEIVDLSNIEDNDVTNNKDTDTEINTDSIPKINIEVDIHRDISYLSLRDVDDHLEIISNDILSQSILNNIEDIDKLQGDTNITFTRVSAEGYDKVKTINSSKETVATRPAVNKTISNLEKKIPIFTIKPNVISTVTNKTDTNINQNFVNNAGLQNTGTGINFDAYNQNKHKELYKTCFETNQITQLAKQPLCVSKKRGPINNSNGVLLNEQSLQVNKVVNSKFKTVIQPVDSNVFDIPANTSCKAQCERHTTDFNKTLKTISYNTVTEDTVATNKKRRPRKKKTDQVNEIKPKTKRINQRRKKTNVNNNTNKNTNVPIYNSNIENDLSWIENIRYVREVREDEIDLNLVLEGSFWDNYELPANWDEF